jgi:streptogramin lyase
VSADLVDQLAAYGGQHRAAQAPIVLSEIVVDDAETPSVGVPPSRDVRRLKRFRPRIAVAAAAAVVLLVGGLAWLAGSEDRISPADDPAPTTTTTTTSTSTTSIVPTPGDGASSLAVSVGPGLWTVAATFVDGERPDGEVAALVEEARSWPGVIDVAEASDAAMWRELTGLSSDCVGGETAPPCGPGFVVLTVDSSMAQTALRLESEFAMSVRTPLDVPQAFVEGYVDAAIETASPVPLDFDASQLGIEQPLSGPFIDFEPEVSVCDGPCAVAVEVETDGVVARTGLTTQTLPDGTVLILLEGGGHPVGDLLIDRSGMRGVLAELRGTVDDRRVYVLGALPLEAAIVTFEMADGATVWQQPLAGLALIVDAAGTGEGFSPDQPVPDPPELPPAGPFRVYDASGAEIMQIRDTSDGPVVDELTITASTASDPTVTVGDGAGDGDGESVEGVEGEIVATVDGQPSATRGEDLVASDSELWLHTSDRAGEVVVRVDAATGEVDRIPIEGSAGDLVLLPDALWVATLVDGNNATVQRIDLASRAISDTLEIPGSSANGSLDAIVAAGGLWVNGSDDGYVRIDLETRAVETLPATVGQSEVWVGEIGGGLWSYAEIAPSSPGQALSRIDLASGETQHFDVDFGAVPSGAVSAGDAIWLTSWNGLVARFDTGSGEITDRLSLGEGVAWGGGVFVDDAVWLSNVNTGTITRIDTRSAEVTDVIIVEPSPVAMVALDGAMWVVHAEDDSLVSRIDIATRQVTDLIEVGSGLLPPAASGEAIWIASSDGTITRIRIDP